MLYKVVQLTITSVDETLLCFIQWKLLIHVVLFFMLYKVVLILKSVDETLVCDYSNESYWAVRSCDNFVQHLKSVI